MYLKHRLQVTQPTDSSYRLIPLTQGQVCKVDAHSYEWLMQWNWCATFVPKMGKFYAVRGSSKTTNGKKSQSLTLMHRVVFGLPCVPQVDHENGDTLDNRRHNLRSADHIQNAQNTEKRSHNKSGFKGVCRYRSRWKAQIKYDGKNRLIGVYDTAEEASAAYQDKAKGVFGSFYRTALAFLPAEHPY